MDQPEGFFFPLDPMQRPAVEAAEGVSLVTGGTGTGKTHVMVARVAYLLNEGVDPGHITCLAARGEAAADLRYRLGCHPRTWGHLDDIFVGTIHEYATIFLRRAGAAVLRRSPEYTIWDRRRAVEAVRIAWSDHYETGLRKREIEEALDWYWRNRNLLPISPPYPAMHGFWLDVEEVYKEEKRLQGAVDPVDLLVMAVGAMERDDDVRTEWRSTRSRHLLVDQVEDLTPRRLQLLELMVGPSRSLMVTTDLNQGIVTADPNTTIELLRLNHQTWQRHVLRFDQVSSKELGEVASTLQRDAGHGRGLWDYGQVCDGVDGGAPVLVEVEGTLREMYSSCLDQAQRLADDGIPWGDMAILYRRGRVDQRLATQLVHRDIPYRVLGSVREERSGDARLVVALLTCLLHPEDLDSVRIAAAPGHPNRERKLPAGSSLRLRRLARASQAHLIEAARRHLEVLGPEDADHRGLSWLVRVWEELDWELRAPRCGVQDLLLLAQHRLREMQPPGLSSVEDPEFETLRRLCAATSQVRGETARMHLQRFLDRWSMGFDAHVPGPVQGRRLTLSPIHAAKGLRWRAVFVLDVSDRTMPGQVGDYSDRLEREQRAFYTAVTRATQSLYLYCPADTGRGAPVRPTRFLDPIIHLVDRRRVGIREVRAGTSGTGTSCQGPAPGTDGRVFPPIDFNEDASPPGLGAPARA